MDAQKTREYEMTEVNGKLMSTTRRVHRKPRRTK